MNVVETAMIATPILGAFGGGLAVRDAGTATSVSAIVVGVAVGLGLLASLRVLAKVWPSRGSGRCPDWLAALLIVFVVPLALPTAAFFASRLIVSAGFHL